MHRASSLYPGFGQVKKFAARSFMATILVASTLLSLFSAVTSASAATTVSKGHLKPTSIGIGTNINISTPDPGAWPPTPAATCTSVVSRASLRLLMRRTPPTGSYAAEAEGPLTVVRGKLAMNPIKKSWGGDGFRFGTVGFGSQFRPSEGSTVLVVAGINSWIENMNTGRGRDLLILRRLVLDQGCLGRQVEREYRL